MHGFQPASARKAPNHASSMRERKAEGGVIRGPGTGTSDSIEDTVPAGTYIMPADSTQKIGDQALEGMGDMGARGFKPKSQRRGVDVRLSNGEYELPPEQVHAVGVQALDALKHATHEQVGEGLGFGPGSASEAMFFANGGEVTRVGNSYSGGNVAGPVTINGGAPRGTVSVIDRPAAPAGFGAPGPTLSSVRHLPSGGEPLGASGFGFRPRGYADGGLVDEDARRRASSFGDAAAAARDSSVVQLGAPRPAAASAGSRDLGASIPAPLPMLTPSLPPSPQAQQMAGFGAPSATPAAPAAAPSPSPLDTDPRVRSDRTAIGGAWDRVKDVNDRVSRGIMDATTYPARMALTAYDNTVVRGMRAGGLDVAPLAPALAPQGTDPSSFAPFSDQKPGLGFGPTARANTATQAQVRALDNNPANASAIAAAGVGPNASPARSSPAAVPVAPALTASGAADALSAPGGFGPTAGSRPAAGSLEDANAQAANLRAFNASVPVGGLSVIGNPGPAAAQAMFDQADLRTAAARGAWSPRRGFQSDQGAIAAAAVPVQNRQQAELEAGRQAADTQRAGLGFQSAAQREAAAARLQAERIAAEDRRAADTNSIRREEVAGANRLRDTQVAAAQDEAALRRIVLDPNSSVADRARARQDLLAAQGKVSTAEWRPVALQGSTDASGNKTEGVLAAVNSATGEVRRLDQGQGGAARVAPPATAVQALKADPKRAAEFDAKYGPGSAQRALQ